MKNMKERLLHNYDTLSSGTRDDIEPFLEDAVNSGKIWRVVLISIGIIFAVLLPVIGLAVGLYLGSAK